MNILFIAPYVPSRIRVRPFYLIKELSRRHKVTVVALGELGGRKVEGADELPGIVEDLHVVPHSTMRGLWQSLVSLPTPTPMCSAFCRSSAMASTISRVVKERRFDVVHIEHLRAAHFAAKVGDIPVVFDSVDCLTSLFRQMAVERKNPIAKLVMMEEALKLHRFEPRILERLGRVVITTESERAQLLELNPDIAVDVIENGVDTEYFAPGGGCRVTKRIVFSGKMGYHPNAQAAIWFAEQCFPRIREKHPDAEFVIVGSGPPAGVLKLAEMPGVKVTGYVDDIRVYLDSAAIAVVPMLVAVGIQNKVLEAMAMELPVIASPIALRTLGRDCPGTVCAEGSDETVREALRLLDNPSDAQRIGHEGRAHVIGRYSWESSALALEQIYAQVG
ncbi:MAG: glycosyltransferase [Armatimonadota bacterium]|nr:glycosyltransferase [bacterium]